MLARQQNGNVKVGLPKTGKLLDGRVVSNYHLLPQETLTAEGWLPYIDEKPEYDSSTHRARPTGYDVQEEQIVRTYEVVEKTPPQPDPMEELQEVVADLTEIILFGGEE